MSSRAERFRGPIFESSLEPEPLSQKRYFNRGRGASALAANDSFSFTMDSRGGAIFNDPMPSGGVGERSTSTASDARRWWQFQSQVQTSNVDTSRSASAAQAAPTTWTKGERPIFNAPDRLHYTSPHDEAATATACDATRSSSSFCYTEVVRASRAVPLSQFAEAALVAGATESTWTHPTGKQVPSDRYARPEADAVGLVSSHFESRYERPGGFASVSHHPTAAAAHAGPASFIPGNISSDVVLSPPSAHALAASNVKMAGQRAFLDEFLRQFHSRRRTAAVAAANGAPSFEDRRFSPDQPVAIGEGRGTHATHSPPRPLVRWNWSRPGVYEDGGATSSAAYSGVGFAFLPLPEDASPRSAAARADPLGDLFIQAARCLDETPGIAGATASPDYDDGAPYALPTSLLSAGLGDTATAAASTTAFVTWCDQQIAAGRGGAGGPRDEWESLPTLWPWIVRSIRVAAAIAAAAAAARGGAVGSRTHRAGASSPLADVRVPATVEHHTAASTKVGSEAVRELLEKTDFLRGRKPEKLLSVAFGAAAAAGQVPEAGRTEKRQEKEHRAPMPDATRPATQQHGNQGQSKQLARPNWSQARSDDDPTTAGRSDRSVAPVVPSLPYQQASGAPPAVPTPPRATTAEARPTVPLPPTAVASAPATASGARASQMGTSRTETPVQPAARSYAPSTQASGRRGQRSRSVSFTAEEFPTAEGEGTAAASAVGGDDVPPTGISPLEAAALYGGARGAAEGGGGSAASDPTAPNYRDFYRENVVDVRSHGLHVTPPSVPPVSATAAASSRFAASSPANAPAVPTPPPAAGPASAKPPVPLLALLMGGGSGGGSSGPTANLGGSSVHSPGADGATRVAGAEPSPSYGGTISLDTSPVFVSASRGAPASPGATGAVNRGPPSTAIVGADSVTSATTVPPLAPGPVAATRPPPPLRGGRPGSSSGTPLVAAAAAGAAAGVADDSVTAGAPTRRTPSGGRVERRPKVPALPDQTGPIGFGLTSATVPAMPSPRQPAVTMVTVDVGTPVDADQAREVQIELVVPAVRDDYPTEGTLNQMSARGRERRQKLQLDRMRREDAEARGWQQQQQRPPPSGAPPLVPSLAAIAKRPPGPPAPPLPPGNAAQRSAPVRDLQDALPTGGSGWM